MATSIQFCLLCPLVTGQVLNQGLEVDVLNLNPCFVTLPSFIHARGLGWQWSLWVVAPVQPLYEVIVVDVTQGVSRHFGDEGSNKVVL